MPLVLLPTTQDTCTVSGSTPALGLDHFGGRYRGEFETRAEMAEDLLQSTGSLADMPDHLTVYFDFMQVEYATDVVFRSQAEFQPLYEAIVRTAVHVIKAEHVATFLGRKLTNAYQCEVGNDFSTRIQGTRIRHHMGPASIKLYDKFACIASSAPPMTSPSSNTTVTWNSATASTSSSSPRYAKASTL